MPTPRTARILLTGLLLAVAAPLTAQGTPNLAPRTRGVETAPITVYEMSDFQCPYCRRFALNTFPEIDRDYIATGKVRWVFINYPLTMIHPNAAVAAEVANVRREDRQFWEVHDALPEPGHLGTAHRARGILPDARRLGGDPVDRSGSVWLTGRRCRRSPAMRRARRNPVPRARRASISRAASCPARSRSKYSARSSTRSTPSRPQQSSSHRSPASMSLAAEIRSAARCSAAATTVTCASAVPHCPCSIDSRIPGSVFTP